MYKKLPFRALLSAIVITSSLGLLTTTAEAAPKLEVQSTVIKSMPANQSALIQLAAEDSLNNPHSGMQVSNFQSADNKQQTLVQINADANQERAEVESLNSESLEDLNEADDPMSQVTNVSQLRDVQPGDWAIVAVQSLVERYGCIAGYPDGTFRGNRSLSRYEFAAGLNVCLNRLAELIAAGNNDLLGKEDLINVQRLQSEFATELTTLGGRVASLEARTAQLERDTFSPTMKIGGEVIAGITDTLGHRVGGSSDDTNAIFGYRIRLNNEASFTGKDLLRVRLEMSNFTSSIPTTGTSMTQLNYQGSSNNQVTLPHLLYSTFVADSLSITVGSVGVGFPDITDLLTPPSVADDARGIPSLFGEYNPFYRRGGGGAALNWSPRQNIRMTFAYLAGNANTPTSGNGLFNGQYNGLVQLAYYMPQGAVGVAYAPSYSPAGDQVNLTGGTGSFLAQQPFGNEIATSGQSFSLQGFYRFTPHFQIHGWGTYISAIAKSGGVSNISNSIGSTVPAFVPRGSQADIWYWALGMTFPDVGGTGNLPGILFGMPPKVAASSVRAEQDSSYHLETFYRLQLNERIAITPGFWVIFNPENDSRNATQYVLHIRTGFNF